MMDLYCCLLVNAPNCHLSLVLASVVQGDADNCNTISLHRKSQITAMMAMKTHCCCAVVQVIWACFRKAISLFYQSAWVLLSVIECSVDFW